MDICRLGDDIAPWDDYVMQNPLACNYHRVGWKAVIEQSFGHTTRYLFAKNGDRIVGILPLVVMKSFLFGRCVVSLPFFNYGGILADNNEAAEALLVSAQAVAREERASHIEFRHRDPHGQGLAAKQHKAAMILELSSNVESQWQGFDPKLRNQVRKAQKSGLWVQVGGRELLKDFYIVFARNMRDLGTPVYGLPFFKAIVTNSQSPSVIFIVRLGVKPVAVGLASTFKDTVEMPWAASLREHRNLCGNMLLYWEAINFGIRHGFKKFDFGRSTPGDGTYRFKEQWGARPVPLAWEYWVADGGELPDTSPKNPKYKLPIRIWKRLPVAVATWIGPSIVRNIP